MVSVYLKLTSDGWKEVIKSDFWIDRPLLEKLKSLNKIQENNWDGVIIIDGKERSGKSVLGMVCGWYLSQGKMTIQNFAKGLDDAARKISSLPDKSVLIMDEGSLVFSSKDSNSTAQKKLIKLMDVIGQKNMIFIICLPCYFDLNKTIAVRRSLFLCHVYPDAKYNRGNYAFFGERKKKILYTLGKKNYDSYKEPSAEFIGRYLDFEPNFYKDYLELIKKESLNEVLREAMLENKTPEQKIIECEALIYGWLLENGIMKQKELVKIKGQAKATISNRLSLYREEIKPNL
tara:strand:+ start:4084 stop:4950 length:867 start_codon:yes stop_codon:yes gene_type:complete